MLYVNNGIYSHLRRITILLSISVVSINGFTACDRQDSKLTDRERVAYFLNTRDYEAAISILTDMINADSLDYGLQVQLASAYAGAAGLNTYHAYDVLGPYINKQVDTKQDLKAKRHNLSATASAASLRDNSEEIKNDNEIAKFEKLMIHHLTNFLTAFTLAFRLPHIALIDRPKLIQAIVILGTVPEEDINYERAQIYRAVLSLVQYLNFMRDSFPSLTTLEEGDTKTFLCALDVNNALLNFDSISFYLNDAVSSLDRSVTSAEGKVSETVRRIREQVNSLHEFIGFNYNILRTTDFAHRFLMTNQCNSDQ